MLDDVTVMAAAAQQVLQHHFTSPKGLDPFNLAFFSTTSQSGTQKEGYLLILLPLLPASRHTRRLRAGCHPSLS